MFPASGGLFELFYFFIMLSKKLWTLHEVVIFIGPPFRARGFSGDVGLTLPSISRHFLQWDPTILLCSS
jgi:hypothetical protein